MDKVNELEQRIVVLEEYVKKEKLKRKITLIVGIVFIILIIVGYALLINYFINNLKNVLGDTDIFQFLK